jgi:NADH:ubiquinone oxidoreductase subunit F (NADH-binding)
LSAWLLAELAQRAELRGRGGAGFPFARKLNAVAEGRRPVVVLNAAEGEPASAKDQTLAVHAPHRVLDGVALAATALGTREVHLVAPTERTPVVESLRRAVAERRAAGERLRWRTHLAAPGFVSGQARAVVELISGRPGLPVTSWQPEAISGYRNRPTLLSNAETFAQLATLVHLGAEAYAATGTPDEPGTVLLSITVNRSRQVLEVPFGTPWDRVLPPDTLERPLITGGYHGTWASAGQLRHLTVSRAELASHGLALGAGVVIVTSDDDCPVRLTARICEFLAASSARRCGPCLNGLPALSGTLDRLAAATDGEAAMTRVQQLMAMVERRGACAHPDGVVRLVRSLFEACSEEVAAHLRGTCLRPGPARA